MGIVFQKVYNKIPNSAHILLHCLLIISKALSTERIHKRRYWCMMLLYATN